MVLDLSKLASVDAFAAAFTTRFGATGLHALVCNAGVPAGLRQTTAEGFSLDFGVSFIGHFELVRALLPALEATEGSRVVTVSSVMHWFGQTAATADWEMAAFDTYPLHRRALVSSYRLG
jgi:NAD(P)-dependent dehydrogenase (short-subunit alcohol dehydrogenase family)|tara:strand:+ start:705 stop:1064 length:360 start_codon:yes stop_codon:yes gene_type:complete